ncbi:zinc finger protein ubi-d4 B-like isoform X1 [Adelges cooleyi]|uniref:zinc finger protein ubi-d4 B-like isoform X1 n=1 Tax=Adelges cooleyi TaxID=133065 RepID=UPI00217FCB2A|nr:zinc finger protein ubi-d4 B-like isoform X1 [Adelges cooleyi]
MAAAAVEIKPNFVKGVACFISDLSYREAVENSVNYNTRLCIERRMRMPFLDTQTGVAQTHSSLLMHERQRMPGIGTGQIYTYPSKRWRKKRRQYLLNSCNSGSVNASVFNNSSGKRKESGLNSGGDSGDASSFNIDLHTGDSQNAISNNEDSKDSLATSTIVPKDEQSSQNSSSNPKVSDQWYYDEFEMQEMEGFEEPDADSDYDYEESYTKRKKRKGGKPGRNSANNEGTSSRRSVKGSTSGRGRKKGMSSSAFMDMQDPDKPYSCDRPSSSGNNSSSASSPTPHSSKRMSARMSHNNMLLNTSPVVLLNANDAATGAAAYSSSSSSSSSAPTPSKAGGNKPVPREGYGKGKAAAGGGANKSINPSPYCDFCLGDAVSNKSGQPEILISCSDCGRSGHPTCLQFTANMIISVGKYRWQCIECKCCSICGTSDNDDQLLFCDDCDRGYHVYCLTPPLTSPPEGCWSCKLCIKEFHSN